MAGILKESPVSSKKKLAEAVVCGALPFLFSFFFFPLLLFSKGTALHRRLKNPVFLAVVVLAVGGLNDGGGLDCCDGGRTGRIRA